MTWSIWKHDLIYFFACRCYSIMMYLYTCVMYLKRPTSWCIIQV